MICNSQYKYLFLTSLRFLLRHYNHFQTCFIILDLCVDLLQSQLLYLINVHRCLMQDAILTSQDVAVSDIGAEVVRPYLYNLLAQPWVLVKVLGKLLIELIERLRSVHLEQEHKVAGFWHAIYLNQTPLNLLYIANQFIPKQFFCQACLIQSLDAEPLPGASGEQGEKRPKDSYPSIAHSQSESCHNQRSILLPEEERTRQKCFLLFFWIIALFIWRFSVDCDIGDSQSCHQG